jgi:hypothetical protein
MWQQTRCIFKYIPVALGSFLLMDNGSVAAQTSQEIPSNPMSQVVEVKQLRDISPDSKAYQALRSLVERYGCLVGYPDRSYRGNRSLSREEFAVGLNACLNTLERLLQENTTLLAEDLHKLKRSCTCSPARSARSLCSLACSLCF